MSLVGKRAEFKAALDGVPDVKGFTAEPSTPKTGNAWPVWGGGERDDESGLLGHTWSVGVVTPQDISAADAWIDGHLDAIVAALSPVAYVESVAPAQFGTDSNPVNGLLITTGSE
jgi:hypothetical protein